MNRGAKLIILGLVLFTCAVLITLRQSDNNPNTKDTYEVTKVVDGDTLEILKYGKTEKVRLIGVDTPETLDPRKPVQCFGKEASDKTKGLLNGKSVRLEFDSIVGEKDKYGRLLAYVWNENELVNLKLLKEELNFCQIIILLFLKNLLYLTDPTIVLPPTAKRSSPRTINPKLCLKI